MWCRPEHDQLTERSPTRRQVGERTQDAEQWIRLTGGTVRVELPVVERAQWQVLARAQAERGRGDPFVGADLDGVTGGERC